MDKRIFTLQYDKDVPADELEQICLCVSDKLKDDVVIVLPSGYNLCQRSLEELLDIRDTLDAVIKKLTE